VADKNEIQVPARHPGAAHHPQEPSAHAIPAGIQ